ncbi:AAA family ATPase [Exiguobacterium sp. KJ 601]|uniref:AAA family ATPase n=1 Tax=Exiguobacterium sp. KJ 601 TaxID=2782569 RepID=UPI0022AEF786|nr:AAA family ATPase [Exiguobacterium sp. KJ 601]
MKQDKKTGEIEEYQLQELFKIKLEKSDDQTRTLLTIGHIDSNVLRVEKFLHEPVPNIDSLNVIVGENGTGKTTLIRTIQHFLNVELHNNLSDYLLGIFYEEKRDEVYYYKTSEEMKIKIIAAPGIRQLSKPTLENFVGTRSILYLTDSLNSQDFFESRFADTRLVSDRSIGRMLWEASVQTADENRSPPRNPIVKYFNNERERQINFINEVYQKKINVEISIPQAVHIEFDWDLIADSLEKEIEFLARYEESIEKPLYVSRLRTAVQRLFEVENDDRNFSARGTELLLLDFLYASFELTRLQNPDSDKLENRRKIVNFLERIENLVIGEQESRHIYVMIETLRMFKEEFGTSIASQFEDDSFATVFDITDTFRFQRDWGELNSYIVLLENDKDSQKFFYFMNFYNHIARLPYIRTYWGMSTGEILRLNLFSQLYEISIQHDNVYPNENLWILIDEAGSHLHPEWQAGYVEMLRSAASQIFTNRSNIQIILTTHSPIILSDVPRHDVLYLISKTDETRSIPRDRTFGQNIYKLFEESFFLKSVSGSLSTSVMDRLEADLAHFEELSAEEREVLKATIDIIGEDFIRSHYQFKFDTLSKNNRTERVQKSIELFSSMDSKEREEMIRFILGTEATEGPIQ